MVLFKVAFILAILAVGSIYFTSEIHPDIEEPSFIQKQIPLILILRISRKFLTAIGAEDQHVVTRHLLNLLGYLAQRYTFPDVDITEEWMSGVRVKVYSPKSSIRKVNGHQKGLIYYHGGGYVVGNPENYHYILGDLCQRSGVYMFAVDYRKAPQHIYPAALDDAFKATQYIQANSLKEWDIDPNHLVLGGDSAGGHLAAIMSHKLQEGGHRKPGGLILIYPVLQLLSFRTQSYLDNQHDFLVPKRALINSWMMYHNGKSNIDDEEMLFNNLHAPYRIRRDYASKFDLPELLNEDKNEPISEIKEKEAIERFSYWYTNPLNSPLLADNLNHFPETLIISSKVDIILDDAVMMVRRLRHAKVKVEHVIVKTFHGMLNFAPRYTPANQALDVIVEYLNRK